MVAILSISNLAYAEQHSKIKKNVEDYFEESYSCCLLYTSDAADDMQCVDLGGRRIIKKKKKKNFFQAEDGIRD